MPFKVAGTSTHGGEEVKAATAKEALDTMLKFENLGYQKITVKDNLNRRLTRDNLVMLVYPEG